MVRFGHLIAILFSIRSLIFLIFLISLKIEFRKTTIGTWVIQILLHHSLHDTNNMIQSGSCNVISREHAEIVRLFSLPICGFFYAEVLFKLITCRFFFSLNLNCGECKSIKEISPIFKLILFKNWISASFCLFCVICGGQWTFNFVTSEQIHVLVTLLLC